MRAANGSAGFQIRDIATNSGNRCNDVIRKLFQRCEFSLLQVFLNPFLPFFSLSSMEHYGRF